MKSFSLFLFIAFNLLFFSSCTGYSKKEKAQFDKELRTFMKKSNLHLTKSSSGIYYKVATQGKGKTILYNDQIRVMYKGKRMDGTTFDEKNTPVTFLIKKLIPAWKEVLIGQKEGSVFYIATPPQMGYGNQQYGDIPPNSCLFFEIKLMQAL